MYLGDFRAGATIRFKFNTRQGDGTPITLADTPTLRVFKDSGDTEDDSGITLSVDDDSTTGMHDVAIDTSADPTFYSGGSDFQVKINAGTVDTISVVGTIIAHFSIENRTVNVDRVDGVDQTATYVPQINAVLTGVPTTTEIEFNSSGLNVDNTFAGWHAFFATGDCAGVAVEVTAAAEAGGTFTLTLETLPTAPAAADNVVLYPPGQLPNVDGIRAAIYHEAILAFIAGKVTISGTDPRTITYFKQDGSTGRFSIAAAATTGARATGADFTP